MNDNDNLTFGQLSAAAMQRCNASFFPHRLWTVNDYATAMGGECGEALNVCKKMRRIETQLAICRKKPVDAELETEIERKKLADELGDMIVYASLLAARAGLKLSDCVVNKFNDTSDRVGSEITL